MWSANQKKILRLTHRWSPQEKKKAHSWFLAAVKSPSGIVAIFFEIDFDPVIGFSFIFQGKRLSEHHLFWFLGSLRESCLGAYEGPAGCSTSWEWREDPAKEHLRQDQGMASGGRSHWPLPEAHGDPSAKGQLLNWAISLKGTTLQANQIAFWRKEN